MPEESIFNKLNYKLAKDKMANFSAKTILRFMRETLEAKKWPESKRLLNAIKAYQKDFKWGKKK